jgi:trk system potassium uptake protein TrkH
MGLIELGGLGIITFVALYIAVPKRRMSLVNRAVVREFFIEDVEVEPKSILRSIILFTVGIEVICAILLVPEFQKEGSSRPVLDAVFHSISAFCNAGFSTYPDSLCPFEGNLAIQAIIMVLIVSGGIGFTVLTDISRRFILRKRARMSFHSRMVLTVTAILILVSAALIFLAERSAAFSGLSTAQKVFASLFSSITPRTAGFAVVPQDSFSPATNLLVIVLMFIGGSPGSIAGGIKTTTFMIVIIYAIRGNAERNGLNILRRNIDTSVVEKAFSIFAKSLMILIVALAMLLCTEQSLLAAARYSAFDLFFEVVSAFGTVGLSLGVTAHLSVLGKIVIIGTMFIGRTGIFAMALGFAHREKERPFEYPSANVLVG